MQSIQYKTIKNKVFSENTLNPCCDNPSTAAVSCLNSTHDNAETIKQHQIQKKNFIIKRSLRKELPGQWLLLARCIGTWQTSYKGKNRYIGVVNNIILVKRENLKPILTVFEVIEQTLKKNGLELLEPKIEVNTWWTNLSEEPETVIHLYNNHGNF